MPEWEAGLPHLGKWQETSCATAAYNCYAFAVEDQKYWWDPIPAPELMYYWPPGAPLNHLVSTFIGIYERYGYARCVDGSLEIGIEKIVIYENESGGCDHVARQLPDGRWTSKIGPDEDIAHETPQSLTSPRYGVPRYFMARKKANTD
jgi:hypothetical protein